MKVHNRSLHNDMIFLIALGLSTIKGMLLSKDLTYLKYSCIFIKETYSFGYIVVWKIYTSRIGNFTPQRTAFEH